MPGRARLGDLPCPAPPPVVCHTRVTRSEPIYVAHTVKHQPRLLSACVCGFALFNATWSVVAFLLRGLVRLLLNTWTWYGTSGRVALNVPHVRPKLSFLRFRIMQGPWRRRIRCGRSICQCPPRGGRRPVQVVSMVHGGAASFAS